MKLLKQLGKSLGLVSKYSVDLTAPMVAEWVKSYATEINPEFQPKLPQDVSIILTRKFVYSDETAGLLNQIVQIKLESFLLTQLGEATPKMMKVANELISVEMVYFNDETSLISVFVPSEFGLLFSYEVEGGRDE